jgi:hypothetical protein
MRLHRSVKRGGAEGAARLLASLALGAACSLLASCFGLLSDLQEHRLGELTIRVADDPTMSMAPSADLTVAGYDVAGTGPEGATFFRSFSGSSATQGGLVFGDWTIVVEGKNAGGTILTFGTGTVRVTTGTSQSVSITMKPVAGPGTLALTVSWDPADVPTPTIASQLVPSQGTPIDLAFSQPSAGQASCTSSAIQNGYYTLVVKLLDNGQLVAGAVDAVLMVADLTTAGSIAFTKVNKGTGSILVNITLQMSS